MTEATITRQSDDGKQTLGTWAQEGFICDTLELPWKDNQHDISCIPKTEPDKPYLVTWTRSARLSTKSLLKWLLLNPGKKETDCPDGVKNIYTYEVMDVPNRPGIRIHSASFFHDLLGCISQGKNTPDMDGDGEEDLTNSRNTINSFNQMMNKESFLLHIN